jgi:hypothetical protein
MSSLHEDSTKVFRFLFMKVYCPQNMFSPGEHTNSANRFCCLLPWDSSSNRKWNKQRRRLWLLHMHPGRLRRKKLNRLDVLSLSPHSIKDFPFVYSPKTERFKAFTAHSMASEITPAVRSSDHPRAI